VQPFILANQFIAEAESWHQATFFEPEDGAKRPEKKLPLMAANAIVCLAKPAVVVSHHLRAYWAFHWTQGTVAITHRRCIFFVGSLMYMSINSEYDSLWMFLMAI